MAAGLGLPVGVGDRAAAAAHDAVVPPPGLGVDGLAHAGEEPEAREVAPPHGPLAGLHERADGRGRGVEDGHLVLLADGPEAVDVRIVGHALEENLRGAVQHRAVGDVGVPGDPAAVRGAEEDVLRVVVKRVLHRGEGPDHVARRGVQHALGLAGAARGVEHEQRVLALHPLHLAGLRLRADEIVEPHVPLGVPVVLQLALLGGATQPPHADDRLHLETVRLRDVDGLVRDGLQLDGLGPPHHAVRGDHEARLRVHDPACQRVRREAAEDHRMHRADAGAGEHRGGQLRGHGQVDRDAIPLLHAGRPERVAQLADHDEEILVRVRLVVVVRVVALVQQRDPRALACLNVPVEAVVAEVCLAPREPLDAHRALLAVKIEGRANLREGRAPVELLCHVAPKLLGILDAGLVHLVVLLLRLDMRLRLEVGQGRVDLAVRNLLVEVTHGW
mmetsp:Transcript_67310/g.190826  ORF Transcript_67310/g.190826 Transcript_67310/m.190826 type:complete len:446 (-) Transcript_67310:60-1397(-)